MSGFHSLRGVSHHPKVVPEARIQRLFCHESGSVPDNRRIKSDLYDHDISRNTPILIGLRGLFSPALRANLALRTSIPSILTAKRNWRLRIWGV